MSSPPQVIFEDLETHSSIEPSLWQYLHFKQFTRGEEEISLQYCTVGLDFLNKTISDWREHLDLKLPQQLILSIYDDCVKTQIW